MKLVAISTSCASASAALWEDGKLTLRETHQTKTHSETIMPLLDELLCESGVKISDIDAFAADVGPGSFTGVRIGVCTVNALAYAVNARRYGVDSLTALYYDTKMTGSVCALIDARNGNGYARHFNNGIAGEALAIVFEEFLPMLPPDTLFVGDGALLHREEIERLCIRPAFSDGDGFVSARGVALAAAQKLTLGSESYLVPMYLRLSQAERLYKEK